MKSNLSISSVRSNYPWYIVFGRKTGRWEKFHESLTVSRCDKFCLLDVWITLSDQSGGVGFREGMVTEDWEMSGM